MPEPVKLYRMTLAPGARLGPYEIVSQLGAGGMGEVYRARDTRLDRIVAIKVLPSDASESTEARERFDREARTISQISHPHICPLFDVGEDRGVRFLVMPLLDGETLAARLAKSPLPADQTIRYAMQMADALDAAHRAGIVHRDLKPANVMVTKSGLKLLDFGLAKPTAFSTTSAVNTVAPITVEGAVAGTVQYMAPEQLEGRGADHRSDIWALGAVIYEMATGTRWFDSQSRAIQPAALDRIVRTCLAGDPDDRWQSARDLVLQLRLLASAPDEPPPTAERRGSWLPWTIAVGACALAALAVLRPSGGAGQSPTVAFDVAPPEGGAFVDSVESTNPALSSDGSQIAYVAEDGSGVTRVWIRPFTAAAARPLAGTEGARHVFWAPSGQTIGFIVGEQLKRLDLPDGSPVTITDVPDVRIWATWGEKQIVYAILPGAIFSVPVAGGTSTPLIRTDPSKNEVGLAWPWFLPDGRRFFYLVRYADGRGVLRLAEEGRTRDIAETGSMAQVLDGEFLVYARDSTLMAQRFDMRNGTVSGQAVPIAEPVRHFRPTGASTFSASQAGALAYQSHVERGRLVWLDRAGAEVGSIGEDEGYSRVRISADGRKVLFGRTEPRASYARIWEYDLERKIGQPVTASNATAINAVWWPGGNGFVFSGGIPPHLIRRDAAGREAEVEGVSRLTFAMPEDVSPDGRTLVFTQRTSRGTFDLWTAPLAAPSQQVLLRDTPFDEASARYSRDGRYLAYAANELGPYEVFVIASDRPTTPIRVSTGGGRLPRWSRDGRELFYLSGDGWLVSVPVVTAPAFKAGDPRKLFQVRGGVLWADVKSNAGWPDYDVSLDGKTFLAVVPDPANRKPLTILLNWRWPGAAPR